MPPRADLIQDSEVINLYEVDESSSSRLGASDEEAGTDRELSLSPRVFNSWQTSLRRPLIGGLCVVAMLVGLSFLKVRSPHAEAPAGVQRFQAKSADDNVLKFSDDIFEQKEPCLDGDTLEIGIQGTGHPCTLTVHGSGAEVSSNADADANTSTSTTPGTTTTRICASADEDCRKSQCCKVPGTQCYAKDDYWAQCRPDCTPGPDIRGADPYPWTCEPLGTRAPGEIPTCAANGEDCSYSKCCAGTGYRCYEKVNGTGQCKAACQAGPDPTDVDSVPWTCKPLGELTEDVKPWVAVNCSQPGQNCADTRCCAQAGHQCFSKDANWADCKPNACKNPNAPWLTIGWKCEALGSRTPAPLPQPWEINSKPVAPWVAKECAKPGEDCRDSMCCAEAGMQCYEKTDKWAACKPECTAGPDLWDVDGTPWSCKTIGTRTPGPAAKTNKGLPIADWVKENCTEHGVHDCTHTQCCQEVGMQCYAKNEGWAICDKDCTKGNHTYDPDGKPWSCQELGPRTPRKWGTPSLFCFSVMVLTGTEPSLIKNQMWKGLGIFGCDETAVLCAEDAELGVGPMGPVRTIKFTPAPVVRSKDGTAGNAELFMNVWDAVRGDGRWRNTDWTIKADPDAVLLPDRLRTHLAPHQGKNTYVVNCDKPMAEGPMMFGALEAINNIALNTYFMNTLTCRNGLDWRAWGEDWYMEHCFDKLGVQKTWDFSIYSDGVCKGVDCNNKKAAAFHPKKDVVSWMACYNQAIAAPPPPPQWR